MESNPVDNPLAKFFMPKDKEECDAIDKRKGHECGFFGLSGTEAGLNLMTETACIGAGIFHKSTDDMIIKASQQNGFQSDIPYVQNLLSLGTTDPGLESVVKAQEGEPLRTWENKLSFPECFKLTQNDKFIDGLYAAIQDGSVSTSRPIYDKQHAAAEFQSKCVIDAATTSLCKLGLAAKERDTHIPVNPKPSPAPLGPVPEPPTPPTPPSPNPTPPSILKCVDKVKGCDDPSSKPCEPSIPYGRGCTIGKGWKTNGTCQWCPKN